jgi:ubiquinone biosynthesis protein UbiJ
MNFEQYKMNDTSGDPEAEVARLERLVKRLGDRLESIATRFETGGVKTLSEHITVPELSRAAVCDSVNQLKAARERLALKKAQSTENRDQAAFLFF